MYSGWTVDEKPWNVVLTDKTICIQCCNETPVIWRRTGRRRELLSSVPHPTTRERRQSHKWIWMTYKIYDWLATWSRLRETEWLAATSHVNDRRRPMAFMQLSNAWVAPVITQILIFSVIHMWCVYYCVQASLKILYRLCISNDRELIIMNSRLRDE